MWRSRLPFWVKEAPHWLHWKGRSPEDKNTTDAHYCKGADKTHRKRTNFKCFFFNVFYQAVHDFFFFNVFLLSLISLCLIPPLTTTKAQSLCLFYVDEKARCCCGNAGSLHYKHPERQNKPDDGASPGQRAIQQPVGGFHSRVTLHLSMLPLPHRLLALWSNKSLSDSACQFRNAPLPRSIWSENLIFSSSSSLK